jgi:type I restriction enzyme S subunit
MTDIMLAAAHRDWHIKRLGQLFRERKEKVSDNDFAPLSVTKHGIVPQLDTAAKTDDGDNRKGVRAGDFVINSRSDRKGSSGLSELDGSVSLINIVLEPRGIFPRFAHHVLRSSAFQEEFYRWGHGIVADLWTTRYFDMKNIRIALPPLDTQKDISAFLDRETVRIDDLIEKKQRMVELLLTKKKLETAWVVRHGLNREAPLKFAEDEWVGQIPVHWSMMRVKSLFRQVKRQNHPNLTVLSVYREFGVIVKNSREDNINKTPEDLTLYQLVQPCDLVVNKMKAWQGSLGISEYLGITSPDYVVFAPTSEHHSRFIHHYLRAQPLPAVYMSISNGIRPDQWRLEPQQFRNIPIWLPGIAEQESIAKRIDAMAESIDRATGPTLASIDRLHELRSALITAAVTGQIDVNEWQKRGSTHRRLDVAETEVTK